VFRPIAPAGLGSGWLRVAFASILVAVGLFVVPVAASAGLGFVLPPGPVSGTVDVSLDAPPESGPVALEWSPDEGVTWLPISVDGSAEDGFTAVWETADFSGLAVVRAIAAGEVQELRVEVDNVVPVLMLSTKHPRFSPNGDGRRDTVELRVRTDEGGTLSAVVRKPGGRLIGELVADETVEAGKTVLSWDGTLAPRQDDERSLARVAADGVFVVEVILADAAGNIATITREVVIDTVPPRLSWRVFRPSVLGPGPLRLGFRTADPDGEVVVIGRLVSQYGRPILQLIKERRAPGRATYKLTSPIDSVVPGGYRVELEVRDLAGNARTRSKPLLVTGVTKTRVIRRLPTAGRRVALTFDDCNEAAAWSSILKTLAAHGKYASFFCLGRLLPSRRSLALRTIREGHTIGAHGWDHKGLRSVGYSGTLSRLNQVRDRWWSMARVSPVPYFRPPYGRYDASTLAAARDAGYRWTVLWDVDPSDYLRPGAGVIASRVLSAVRPGSIVVLHAIARTASDLPAILDGLRARNLEPVGLDELFRAAGSRWRRR
jgi:peptidoglycan/xylan/chitin deacetylase (PgdA/CDA1 family)